MGCWKQSWADALSRLRAAMTEFTTYQWLALAVPVAIALASFVWHRFHRSRNDDAANIPKPFQTAQEPTITDSLGTPSLQQLTQGMKLNSKAKKLAEALYDLGLEQYNHPVNNRDRIIRESREITNELATVLSLDELKLADEIGRETTVPQCGATETQQSKAPLLLSPNARTYAHHKKRATVALESAARDLAKNVPRTDYTFLKQRIASRESSLEAIVDELPVPWQSIRELNEKSETPEVREKPPKQEKVIAEYVMADGRVLRDKRAEIDGDWLTSHKYNFLTPCPPPTQILLPDQLGRFARKGEKIREVSREPSSEWLTEFWRRGGYCDQVYLRARAGKLPHQLRRAYRRRQIRQIQWSLLIVGVAANIAIFIINNS